jgi:hypothetical protein
MEESLGKNISNISLLKIKLFGKSKMAPEGFETKNSSNF